MELSSGIKDLYQRLSAIRRAAAVDEDVVRLEVDDMASKLAILYERIRNTIDYKEDQLLRRFSLERNFKRRLVLDNLQPRIARSVIEDVIRARYLPNRTLPETLVPEVERVIAKYQIFFKQLNSRWQQAKNKRAYQDWIVGIMACEVDLILAPEKRYDALIEALYSYVKDRVKVKGQGLTEREKNIQLYIAIHKNLLLSDNQIISYHLLNLYFPDWLTADAKLISFIAEKLPSIYLGIQQHLNYPHHGRLTKALKKELAMFKVLKQMMLDRDGDLSEVLSDPQTFQDEARKTLQAINNRVRSKITRRSLRAIVYIFLTKMVLALALEYPYDLWVIGRINYLALGTNIIFPPFLMFTVALSARLPKVDSQTVILDSLMTYVYDQPEEHTLIILRNGGGRSWPLMTGLYLVYTILYCVTFGFLIYFLRQLGFNILSIVIFIFFVTVVSFFALRIRQQAKEFNVVKERQGVISYVLNFFSLPIIKLGQLLSSNMRRINIFIFLFDFILEAPFKLFVEAFEIWSGFLKEKREEIYKE